MAVHGGAKCACGGVCPRCRASAAEGQPLPSSVTQHIGRSTSADLSSIRVHTDDGSHRTAEDLHANAFTIGRDIHFGAGQFRPGTPAGDRVIAHEVAHAIQPDDSSGAGEHATVSNRSDAAESEADDAAGAWMSGRSFAPSARRHADIHRDDKTDDDKPHRKTFLSEGFTGRETVEEARLIAASKGWVVEGALHWNGRNWIGENVRRGTGKERAIAQVQLNLSQLPQTAEALGGDIDIDAGFSDETPYSTTDTFDVRPPRFGEGTSETGEGESDGRSKEGDPTGTEKGSKEDATGTTGSGTGTGANELDPLTALSSFLLDPSSLSELKKNTTGESGSPAGGIGWITGPLAKVLTVFAAALSIFTGPILKLFGKLGGFARKFLGPLFDRFRGFFRMAPKMVPGGPKPPTPPVPPGAALPEGEALPGAGGAADDAVPREIPNESAITNRLGAPNEPLGERVGDYIVNGEKRLNGQTFEREILGLKFNGVRPVKPSFADVTRPIDEFFGSLIAEARAAGATELRIYGGAIRNPNVMRLGPYVEQRLGGTVVTIDSMTKEWRIPIR